MRRRAFITLLGGVAAGLSPGWPSPLARAQTAASRIEAKGGGRGPTVAEDVARWLVGLRYEEVPPDVIARAKRVLLDTLGCALGAIAAAPVRAAQQVVALQGGNPQATILGLGRKASCDQAAFLNGMALRYFDYNDYIALGRPNHASINVAPALAVAEMQGASGQALLLGLVAGYELEVRLRDAIAAKRREGWDDTSIEAQYAAAATAGKLLQLDEVELANALAIAGSNANTLAEVRRGAELTPAKGSAEPMAARNGVFAALLARAGLTYPLTIFEGENGFAKMVSGPLDEAILRQRSGDFQILKSCIKLWPCVGTAQAPIAAALEIQKRQPRAEEISSITVALSDFAYRQQAAYPEDIRTREHADHSIPYLVARALLDGDVRVTDFEEKRFKDPRALALKRRLAIRPEASLSNENLGANLEVTLQNGTVLTANVPIPPGNMLNPAGDAELTRKFLALSETVLGRARAQRAIEVILSVDTMPDLGDLLNSVSLT
ncbi:MAG TPA: MmgE/PrpD family protein [Xanthobacteraceae bacterium]|nr:MmgE/PrpD family protein [Xanthobacteraceae bacterium]